MQAGHQLRLGVFPLLEMQAPDHSVARFRLVVLHEPHRPDQFVEPPLRETLHKITPCVPEHLRFEKHHAGELRFYRFHRFDSSITFNRYRPYWFLSICPASARIFSSVIQPLR